MKKMEYSEVIKVPEDKPSDLNAEKYDDPALPEFVKEVPVSSKRSETATDVSVDYNWKKTNSQLIRIKKIVFRKGESLSDFYRVNLNDGADSICIKHNGTLYILRKTSREVAQSLYAVYGKIKGLVENVVGYLRTLLGNDYVISKVERESWTFDTRLANNDLHFIEPETLDRKSRGRLCEYLAEKISDLHFGNLIIGRFSLNNIILGESSVVLTDLRKVRASRKRSFVVEEFKTILQYLFGIGVASREDVYFSIAHYVSKNPQSCDEWYHEKTRKKTKDSFEIATKLEEDVYS